MPLPITYSDRDIGLRIFKDQQTVNNRQLALKFLDLLEKCKTSKDLLSTYSKIYEFFPK